MRVAGILSARGWAEGSAGNITVRLAAAPPADRLPVVATQSLAEHVPGIGGAVFLSSATGTRMGDIAEGRGLCIVRVSGDGNSLEIRAAEGEPGLAPTSEFPSHLRIHELLAMTGRPERAVVHTHPTELIALTHVLRENGGADMSRVLWSMHPEVKVFLPEGIGLVPYTLPGSFALARGTVEALRDRRLALWEMHGAVAVGVGPAAAFDLLDVANKAARLYLLCRAAGVTPRGLDDAALTDLARAFGKRDDP
jgi:rhamnulose-1-phosphate aldolase